MTDNESNQTLRQPLRQKEIAINLRFLPLYESKGHKTHEYQTYGTLLDDIHQSWQKGNDKISALSINRTLK